MEFKLQAEFGELDNVLKAMGLVASELRFPPKAGQGDAGYLEFLIRRQG